MSRAVMQQALEALEGWANHGKWVWPESALEQAQRNTTEAITALRAALAEPTYPVAWRTFDGEGGYDYRDYDEDENYAAEWAKRNPNHAGWVEPLYTSAPTPRKPLTDEEIKDLLPEPDGSAEVNPVRIVTEDGWPAVEYEEVHAWSEPLVLSIAHAVIAAYEAKNGITGETK